MVKKSKLKQDYIFSLSCSHLHCPKWNHIFTNHPTRGLSDSLAPRAIHLASCPSIPETPEERKMIHCQAMYPFFQNFSNSSKLFIPKISQIPHPSQNSHTNIFKKITSSLQTSSLLFITQNFSSSSLSINKFQYNNIHAQ